MNEISANLKIHFFEDPYNKGNKKFDMPPDLMTDNEVIVCSEIFFEFLKENTNDIKFQEAVFIDNNNKYHEEYWVIFPTKTIEVIDMDHSLFTIEHRSRNNNPYRNTYNFEKIVLNRNSNNHISNIIFYEPFIKEIVLNRKAIEFITENKLKGFSFLEIQDYRDDRIFVENSHILKS